MKKKPSQKELANLKPFKKGNPGGGRPKGSVSLVKLIERMLENKITVKNPLLNEKEEKKRICEAIVTTLFAKAISGDVQAIKELLDRVDGKVIQKTENQHTGKDGDPIQYQNNTKLTVEMMDDRISTMMES